MKKYLTSLVFSTALLLAPAPVILTGCSTTAQRVEFNTLGAVAQTVDSALKAYADALVAGRVPYSSQQVVADAKQKYAAAFTAAVAAARGDQTSITPANVQQLADSLAVIIKTVTN